MKHGAIAVAAIALAAIFLPSLAHATIGDVAQVGPIGNTGSTGSIDPENGQAVSSPGANQDVTNLCNAAPLRSFGAGCLGITWAYDVNNQPVELRDAVVPVPDVEYNQLPQLLL